MKIKNLYSDCICNIPNKFNVEIKSNENLLLVDDPIYNLNLVKILLIKLIEGELYSVKKENGDSDVGLFTVSFQNENSIFKYTKTLASFGKASFGKTVHEFFYKDNNLMYFVDHENLDGFINKKLVKENMNISKLYFSTDITHVEETLRNLKLNLYHKNLDKNNYKPDAVELAKKIIINSDLGIKDIDFFGGTVITSSGIRLGFSDTGSGAYFLLKHLPGILNSILGGGVCILSDIEYDFCSLFHPILLRELLRVLNMIAKKNDAQVMIPWYYHNTNLEKDFILQGIIDSKNSVSLFKKAENLIIE